MKILLVYANTYEFLSPPPIGISLLTGPLRGAGHELQVIDLMKEGNPDLKLKHTLGDFEPDFVGFSLRNLDNQKYPDFIDFTSDFARWVHMSGQVAPTMIGGSAVMAMPEELFEFTGATYGMVGQGEQAFPEFLDEIDAGKSDFKSPGVIWWKNGQIQKNPGLLNGYSDGGTIDWSVIDFKRYRKSYMNCCVITKTGCPHKCLFCDAGTSFGSGFVPRDPEAILEDLRRDAVEYRLNRMDYFFIDALFNEPMPWAKSLLETIIQSELKLCFSVIIEPTNIDQEFARLLRRAGCVMVTTLLNSMDDQILETMNRPFTVDQVDQAFEIFEDEHIHYMPQFLLGGPGETRKTVLKNLKHMNRWKTVLADANYGIRILPKAEIRNIAVREGLISGDKDLLKPCFYLSEELKNDLEWLGQQVKEIKRFRVGSLVQWADLMWRSFKVRFQS